MASKREPKILTQADLLRELSEANNITVVKLREIISSLQSIISRELNNNEVMRLFDLGKFRIITVKERTGVNPITKKPIKIPAGRRVKFSVSGTFAEKVTRNTQRPKK